MTRAALSGVPRRDVASTLAVHSGDLRAAIICNPAKPVCELANRPIRPAALSDPLAKIAAAKDVDMTINGFSAGTFDRRRFAAAALAAGVCAALFAPTIATAQTAPSEAERAAYTGLHRAAALGDAAQIRRLLA